MIIHNQAQTENKQYPDISINAKEIRNIAYNSVHKAEHMQLSAKKSHACNMMGETCTHTQRRSDATDSAEKRYFTRERTESCEGS